MLKCQYCGKEFSEKVLPFHEERCTEKDKVKTEEKKVKQMATGMREKTTNVGGIIKRIWYAMTGTTQGTELMSVDDAGTLKAKQFAVPALNTAPASPTATGTVGEIRVAAGGIYYCTAKNTWGKALPVTVYTETITELTSTFTNSTLPGLYYANKYQWNITSGSNGGVIESTHNLYAGNNFYSLVTGATVQTVTANSVYSMRIGDSVLEIKFSTTTGAVSYRIVSGTVTEITVRRLQYAIVW